MVKKILLAIEAAAVVGGMLLAQGCFEERSYPAYGGGYYDYPASGYYSSGPTVVYRDYDEHPHHWWQHEAREEREEHAEHRAERREHHEDHDHD